ncbi:MAG TPA: glycosyl hydrolase family 18 protein [Terracidiphilus sp.]|jgi:chitinase
MGSLFPLRLTQRVLISLALLASLHSFQTHALKLPALRQHAAHPVVVGYFPQWGIYNPQPYYVKMLVTSGSAAHLDQINYSQGSVAGGHCSLADPNADLNTTYTAETGVNRQPDDPNSPFRGYFHQLQQLKRRYPQIKLLISLEGKADDFALDAQPQNRHAFVSSCIDTFIRGRFAANVARPGLFDGFDIDWESPQVADAANFRALLVEFRRQMDALRPGLRLAIAVGQDPHMLPGTNFADVAPLVDQVGIMNYDYAGPWSNTTGLLAPLFPTNPAPRQALSIERSIASYRAAGVPQRKLLMGLPFYGYSWTAVSSTNNGLFQTGRAVHSDRPYNYIRTLASLSSAYRDPRSQAPWLYDGQTFWTYEDPVSVRYKASYAYDQSLGGVMIWELSGDTADAELLRSAWHSLHHPLSRRVFAKVATPPEQLIEPPAAPATLANPAPVTPTF